MILVDSHCHLDDEQFAFDRDAVVERALAAGVREMLAIGTGDGPPDLEAGIRLAGRYSCIKATVGVHPHNASKYTDSTGGEIRSLRENPKVVAVGEIGLDYHYDFSPREVQRQVFIDQIEIAREANLPIIIHTREAWGDTFDVLEQHWAPAGIPGIMHCFSGGPAEAKRSLDMGFLLSFGGIVTYPKAVEVQEAARTTPLDRLLIETDAPYLAPVPKRGKRNEPAYVVETAKKLAMLRGVPVEAIAEATTSNFRRVCQAGLGR